ncbi:MAG: ketopantoate reductase family protein, partial [Hyphomicrobiales bacterium]
MPSASSISASEEGAAPRIAVFGAGAIGSTLGGRLAEAGRDVVLIARGAHLAAMRDDGLVLEDPDGRARIAVRATDDPASAGPQDLVVFTVKAHQLAEAVAAAKPMLGPQTTVITAINGLPWWYFRGIGGDHEG